jgi:short subunit dehydrogenase-like uncharacterized protein
LDTFKIILFRYHEENKRPAQIGCYIQMSNLLYCLILWVFMGIFGIFASFRFGRKLLEDYPGFFSFGAVSKKGPSRRMAENTNFEMKLVGQGWEGKDEGSLTDLGKETSKVEVTVKGKNIGYGSTCECLVQAALVILQEQDKLPGKGGVLTPGFAFQNTTLVQRLNQNGVTFTVNTKFESKI